MGARGESVIRYAGHEVQVLFTNRAILNAEQQLNKGILAVLDEFMRNVGGYTELVALLRAGMEAARIDARSGGKPISNNDALEVLDGAGFTAVVGPVMEALAAVISYTTEADGSQGPADPNG